MQARFNTGMARPDDLSTLAGRLAYARTRRGLTQVDLAEKAGVQQPAISKLVRGKMQKTTAIGRLAAALDVPVEWLEDGVGPEPVWKVGEPPKPGPGFADVDRKPTPKQLAFLQALEWLPENEVEALIKDVLDRSAKYEEFVQRQTEKIGRHEIAPRLGREHLGGIDTGFGALPGEEESSDG